MTGVVDRFQWNSRVNIMISHSGEAPNQLTFAHASLGNASSNDITVKKSFVVLMHGLVKNCGSCQLFQPGMLENILMMVEGIILD